MAKADVKKAGLRKSIVSLHEKGLKQGEICRVLDLSKATVSGHLKRHQHALKKGGINGDKYTPEEDAIILKLHSEGKNCTEVAEALNRGYDAVRKHGAIHLGLSWNRYVSPFETVSGRPYAHDDEKQRHNDRLFVREMAKAFQRGDHLPGAKP